MSEQTLADYVARVRAYLHTPEGDRNRRLMMVGFGWSYERAVAESVMHVCGLRIYERIREVADAVLIQELAGEAA
jgi:hypothetical protein